MRVLLRMAVPMGCLAGPVLGCCVWIPCCGAAYKSVAMCARCVCVVLNSVSEIMANTFVVLSLNSFS